MVNSTRTQAGEYGTCLPKITIEQLDGTIYCCRGSTPEISWKVVILCQLDPDWALGPLTFTFCLSSWLMAAMGEGVESRCLFWVCRFTLRQLFIKFI